LAAGALPDHGPPTSPPTAARGLVAFPDAETAGADVTEMFQGAEYFSFGGGVVLATVGTLHSCLRGIMVLVKLLLTSGGFRKGPEGGHPVIGP